MYRAAAEDTQALEASGTLVIEAKNRERSTKAPMALMQIFTAPALVAIALSVLFDGTVAIVGMIASAIAMYLWWRRGNLEQVTLQVKDRTVAIAGLAAAERVAFEDLFDVSLERKTVHPVQDGGSAIPAMRFIDSTVGPEVDTARVVLELRGKRVTVALTKRYLSYSDATEWLSKVRVFLRKRGWVPLSERDREHDRTETPEDD